MDVITRVDKEYTVDHAETNFVKEGIKPNLGFGTIAYTDRTINFQTIEEALKSKNFMDIVRQSFTKNLEYVNKIPKHTVSNTDVSAVNLITTDYPKIIFDGRQTPLLTKEEKEYLLGLGELNLPFPGMALVIGLDTDDFTGTELGKDYILEEKPKANITSFELMFLCQAPDEVVAVVSCYKPYEDKVSLTSVRLSIENNKLFVGVGYSKDQKEVSLLNEGAFDCFVERVMYGIYKMTVAGGDFHISVPTKREVQVNRKKIRKGKAPTVEFRLVKIEPSKPKLPTIPHGTHASPKQHWRRGHWRNLASGKRVFIKPMLVGDEKNGKIIKDYVIGGAEHAH